jgi:hypothetical protein
MKKIVSILTFISGLALITNSASAHRPHWGYGHYNPYPYAYGYPPPVYVYPPRPSGAEMALGIFGSIMANQAAQAQRSQIYRERRRMMLLSPQDKCRAVYRSYEPTTGLFTTNSGEKKLCPFLRG